MKEDTVTEAIAWDMGGVLVRDVVPATRQSWEARLGLDEGELTRLVFNQPSSLDLLLGRASHQALWRAVEVDLRQPEGSLAALAHDFWGEPDWNDEVFSLIHDLSGCRHAVLSDAWPGTRELMADRISDDVFDVIMFSCEEGIKKPSRALFERMAQGLDLDPAEILFVDDRLVNVEAAQRVGMEAVVFTGLDELRRELELRGCLRM